MEAKVNSSSNNWVPLAIAITIVGAVISLVGLFTMPIVSCEGLDMKVADFGDEWKVRAFDFCANDLGQGASPGSGLGVGALGGIAAFAGGVWFVIMQRRGRAAGPTSAPTYRQASTPGAGPEPFAGRLASTPPARPTQPMSERYSAPAFPPSPVAEDAPSNPGFENATASATPFSYIKPTTAERLVHARPAPFGRRVGAFCIDFAVLAVLWFMLFAILAAVAGEDSTENTAVSFSVFAVLIGIFFAYHWLLGLTGATLGMRALGLRIVTVDGTKLSSPVAAKRAAVLTGGCGILYGPFSGLRHPEGRAWHDLASGTGVVAL